MRSLKTPAEPIYRDAYSIADAMIRRDDQEIRLRQAAAKDEFGSRTRSLMTDILRLDDLIQDRIAAWKASHGDVTTWEQYLADYPRRKQLDRILGVAL